MDLEIKNDAALIAASSSGLGKATANVLAREGAHVMINGRDETKLDEAVEEIRQTARGEVLGHRADLTIEDEVAELVETTVSEFGGIDHLVTNSGGPPSKPFLATTDTDWYDTFDLLVMSTVRLIREAIPYLRQDGGTIVNITSVSVKEALDEFVLTNSVRMGVIGLEKTLSKELAPDVRVNAVLPGTFDTGPLKVIQQGIKRGDYRSYEEGLDDYTQDIPVNRLGDPEELGELIAFLSSPHAEYMNGAALVIDGGKASSNL
jgi:NAD(P)-dependent dehydrogenase (short-subunit alcohol dehydrogenase family)